MVGIHVWKTLESYSLCSVEEQLDAQFGPSKGFLKYCIVVTQIRIVLAYLNAVSFIVDNVLYTAIATKESDIGVLEVNTTA